MPDQQPTGILNINKARGMTSHDVVARVRRITGQRKVGHAGTLDPMATGVLLLCLGKATRVSEYLMANDKVYHARVQLGITTETYDIEGQITGRAEIDHVTRAQVEHELEMLTAISEQVPPMYSAIKHKGAPLYRLARRGETVTRKARTIEIERLDLLEWSPPQLQLEIHCSKGTYVRSLAHDLGQRLGCGAHLTGLVRVSSGRFHIQEAATVEDVERATAQGQLGQLLSPLDVALEIFPAVTVDQATRKSIIFGQRVQLEEKPDSHMCRAYAANGQLVALLRYLENGLWQPHKVFTQLADNESHPRPQPS
jgi:tRNA pseudouridine55 synthase